MDFSQKALNTILEQVADKGFDIYLQAKDKTDLEKAYMACEHVRGKGYRVMLAVESSDNLPDDMKKSLCILTAYSVYPGNLKTSNGKTLR